MAGVVAETVRDVDVGADARLDGMLVVDVVAAVGRGRERREEFGGLVGMKAMGGGDLGCGVAFSSMGFRALAPALEEAEFRTSYGCGGGRGYVCRLG